MIILQKCEYRFPAKGSAGAERIVERLCRGLQKLGHKVYLYGKEGSTTDTGAEVVSSIPSDVDIIHHHGFCLDRQDEYNSWGKPWVSTIHGGGMEGQEFIDQVRGHPNIICVSKFVSDRLGCPAFVHSCASDEEFEFNINPKGGFLYLAGFGWGVQKGLDIFLNLSKKFPKYQFYIAGAGGDSTFVNQIKSLCSQQPNLVFLGEINGKAKSDALKNADALIYPTHLQDACPASVVEALFCGTPVIGSNNGSLPEIVPPECGFICTNQAEYMKAILQIVNQRTSNEVHEISRQRCRKYALNHYSDISAGKKHLVYYENMLKNGRVA